MRKILVVDDELSMRLGLAHILKDAGYMVTTAETGAEGIEKIRGENFDLVITDMRMPGADGLDVLKAVSDVADETGVIVITAFAEVKSAVEAIKLGAYDYIAKPFDPDEILLLVERFLKQKSLGEENMLLREQLAEHEQFQDIVSADPSMFVVFNTIKLVARTDSSVIIYGESGTGKELVTNAIHNLSSKRDKPFIKINCAAIPAELLESELFGHEKGAFTGALHKKKGKLEMANGGTFFFDEIGDMSFLLQSKLLRILEARSFERVGGTETIKLDVRFVFATMRNLQEEIRKGNFREDLYYRINVLPITLPPLRKRPGDIPLLVRHFIEHICRQQSKKNMDIAQDDISLLAAYPFPGNIRELKHAVEMAVTLCPDKCINLACFPSEIKEYISKHGNIAKKKITDSLEGQLKETEKEMIQKTLKETGGRKKAAAEKLGISRETLWRRMKEFDIDELLE